MYNILQDKKNIIRELCDDLKLEAYFTVSAHLKCGNSPLSCIPNYILSFIAETKAELGFDIYCYNENNNVPIKPL
jgi:hypothetical protein